MKNSGSLRFIGAAAFVFLSCACNSLAGHSNRKLVTIEELQNTPKEYFGHTIAVEGYATFEFENLDLWENEAAEEDFSCSKAIGIYNRRDTHDRFNRKTVRITGRFEPLCEGDFADDVEGPDDMCLIIGSCGNTGIRPQRIELVE